jgi:4-amino-4-deoxy-L-arabinose transferase-like glycosyltransferase
MIALTVPWFLAAELKTPGFLRYFIVGEHVERFLVPGWKGDLYGSGHAQARGMIWIYGLLSMLPWTPFLLAPLTRPRRVLAALRGGDGDWVYYLACWSLAPMVFFTMATNIIPTYVISGVPAACLLGLELHLVRSGSRVRRFFAGTVAMALLAMFLGVGVLTVGQGFHTKSSQKDVVDMARTIAPSAAINYWGKRRFSADFYSVGTASFLTKSAEVAALTSNGHEDLLVIDARLRSLMDPRVFDGFVEAGASGDCVLMIEKGGREVAHVE